MNERVRLLLQYIVDHEGTRNFGVPSILSETLDEACAQGLLKEENDAGGWMRYKVTDAGKTALATRNDELGHHATRYVYKTRFFPGAGVVPYEAAVLAPISQPTQMLMDCLCI